MDADDVIQRYPPALDGKQAGVIDSLNMTNLTRIQRSYRWQPHLPFMPVNLENHPWTARYKYKFDSLPIVHIGKDQRGKDQWTLDRSVAEKWHSHVNFFSNLVSSWRGQLALAPMSVDYVPDIRDYSLNQIMDTEKKARGYFWYCRTLIFSMFAEFSYQVSAKPNWRGEIQKFCETKNITLQESWLDEVGKVLCDYWYTKRAGVIVDVAHTELWPILRRYHENGVPTFMDVGSVIFHDRDQELQMPTINITNVTGHTKYDVYPKDWPIRREILECTREYLMKYYEDRLGIEPLPPSGPLTVERPPVDEPGLGYHDRAATIAWTNPETQTEVPFLQMAPPEPAYPQRSSVTDDWVEFFDKRRKTNQRLEKNETPIDRQRRESRTQDSLKINQHHSSGPSKKSTVYQWVQDSTPLLPSGMMTDSVPTWKRVKIDRSEVEDVWDSYPPSQREYDAFHNEWDLMVLFDVEAFSNGVDYEEEEEDDRMLVDQDIFYGPDPSTTFLDELDLVPESNPYSNVGQLSSQIAFIAPTNLFAWVCLTLGVRCTVPANPLISYPKTPNLIGFELTQNARTSDVFPHLEEFVSYINESDYENPRLQFLSDLHSKHDMRLDLSSGGLYIDKVKVSRSGASTFSGYILTPKLTDSNSPPGWILVILSATTVIQIIRNNWGQRTMEDLVRHLVQHGVEFRTLIPSFGDIPRRLIESSPQLQGFEGIPAIPNIKIRRTIRDHEEYVSLRQKILETSEGKVAYRMGGIVWRLAMEATGNLDQIIDHIMDGPCEVGPSPVEYFYINGNRYYDATLSEIVVNSIVGMHGKQGGK